MSKTVPVTLNVNGVEHHLDVEPRLLLVHALRDNLGLTGTHVGCDTSNCGACTIHMDGHAVKSCTVLAVQADGAALTTIEGLAGDYATTLGHWIERFDARWDDAVRLAGIERARTWRLYLRAGRQGFETGWASVYQVLAHR